VPFGTRFTFVSVPPAVKVSAPVPVIEPVEVPVPPLPTAIAVPFQTPEVIVPTLVKLEVTTVDFNVVPVKVLASAVTVIAAEPSKFTPLIARGVVKVAALVAVEALPVSAPTNDVDVTDVRCKKGDDIEHIDY
jgi:hypothetical protein